MEKNNDNPEFYKGNEDDDEVDGGSDSTSKNKSEEKKRPTETASFFSERKEAETRQETAAEEDDDPEEPDLNEEELRAAVVAITDEKEVDLRDEIESAPTDSPEQLEAVAHAAFLAGVRARAEREEDFTEETIDEAFEETVDALDLTGNEEKNNSLSDDSELDTESDTEDADAVTDSEVEDDELSTPSAGASTTTSPPVSPMPLSRTSGVTGSSFSGGTPYVLVSPSLSGERHDVSDDIDRKIAARRKKRNDLLVGAVVGYIVGRRGGRKRTEKKLLPKIDRLERQVSLLETAIAEREDKIRVLARKTAQQAPLQSFENNETTPVADTKALTIEERITRFAEKRMEDEKRYDRKKVRMRVETTRTHEKIGSLKLSALDVFVEKRLMDGTEKDIKRKPVEIMTESELLEKVGSLSVDGIRVAEAYNAKRLDLESLREITKRYLRSGDYQRVFRYELKASPQELARNVQHIEHLHEKQPHDYLDREEFASRQTYEGNQNNQKDVDEAAVQKTHIKRSSVINYQLPKPIVAAIILGVVLTLVFLLSQY